MASKIAKDPKSLHSQPDSLREAIAADVAYTLRSAFEKKKKQKGQEKVALKILRFCNELASRDLVLAGAVINVIATTKSHLFTCLIRMARRHREDPDVRPFLQTLKSILCTFPHGDSANALLRDCEVKAAIWAGDTLEQIQARLDHFELSA